MQNRYAGDIGDYLKLALLRALPAESRLAVCWWLHPDENHNSDGRHTDYLSKPSRWRQIDTELFDKLAGAVARGDRSLQMLRSACALPSVLFHDDPVPIGRERTKLRANWFAAMQASVEGDDIVFIDPDNGIDLHVNAQFRCSAKHVTLEEIKLLSSGKRTLVIYHHQTRAKGGHVAEISRISDALAQLDIGDVTAIRARPYSPRVFFVVGPHHDAHRSLTTFANQNSGFFEVFAPTHLPEPQIKQSSIWNAQILTLYPEMFPGPLGHSIAGRALAEGRWSLDAIQIRDFATDKHRSVDDTPAGGGAGMVLRADVLASAVDHAMARAPHVPVIAMTPRGRPLTQQRVRQLADGPGVTILCGRFEGFDERLFEARPIEEISIGDYVLSGGETGALVLLDACVRLLPDVMGASSSGDEESFENGLLEYPHYTRPQIWEGRAIPEVLRSGDHAKIRAWRDSQAAEITRLRRPDLWERHGGTPDRSPSGARRKK